MKIAAFRGAYPADRASALSGVPRSTMHYWARNGYLVPSVSASRIRLWSFPDLMALRTIHWLRHRKITEEGWEVPASTMPSVLRALDVLRGLEVELWEPEAPPSVYVDASGEIFVNAPGTGLERASSGQRPLDPDLLNIIEPFKTKRTRGPDLQKPRPHLRILPGKLSGEPHIEKTRIETLAVASLSARGFDSQQLERLYPKAMPLGLAEAVDLEKQLAQNLRPAA